MISQQGVLGDCHQTAKNRISSPILFNDIYIEMPAAETQPPADY
jgi:hypothetical protein